MFDVIIVGGGPAGLSAALLLGRCRRRVLVCDAGHPRNERSAAMHGFLSRDGMPPAEFGAICREQLGAYPSVDFRAAEVSSAAREGEKFVVTMRDGTRETSDTLLLATGIVDEFPALEGFDQFYGATVHHCPLCDGWEHRDQALAVFGDRDEAADLAMELTAWSRDLVLCTNGPPRFAADRQAALASHDIRVIEAPILRLEGEDRRLRGIRFRDDTFLPRDALFFSPGQRQRSGLAEQLGCKFCLDGGIECSADAATCVPGVFAAGNASRGLQLVIVAAAEGAQAAHAINEALLKRDHCA